jgi:hypothetical protein
MAAGGGREEGGGESRRDVTGTARAESSKRLNGMGSLARGALTKVCLRKPQVRGHQLCVPLPVLCQCTAQGSQCLLHGSHGCGKGPLWLLLVALVLRLRSFGAGDGLGGAAGGGRGRGVRQHQLPRRGTANR